jgi:TldD protein
VRQYKGAFIRVFDGKRWYYSATSEIDNIQSEINALAAMAERNDNIYANEVVKKLEVNIGEHYVFSDRSVRRIPHEKKGSSSLRTSPFN